MKKTLKVLSLAVLSSMAVLAGCEQAQEVIGHRVDNLDVTSATVNEGEPSADEVDGFTSMEARTKGIFLYINDKDDENPNYRKTKQIEMITLPRSAEVKGITYTSANPKVAKVSETGLVTAVGAGETTITVKSASGTKTEIIPVSVVKNELTKREAFNMGKAISTTRATKGINDINKILQIENYSKTIYENDIPVSYYDSRQFITVDYDEAYLKVSFDDTEYFCADGSTKYSYGEWIFYTNEYFETYIYHIQHGVKTYMKCATDFYVDVEGATRLDPVKSILANLFTSGSGIMTSVKENFLGEKELYGTENQNHQDAYTKQACRAGSLNDTDDQDINNLSFTLSETYANQIADYDDEDDSDIPVGTSYEIGIDLDYYFDDYVLKNKDILQTMTYELDGKNYVQEYDIEYSFYYEDVTLDYPDYREYTEVSSLFDL